MIKKTWHFTKKIRRGFYTYLLENRFAPILEVIIVLFVLIGLVFLSVFVGMRFHLFNVRGSIDERNAFFQGDREAITQKIEEGLRQCMTTVRTSILPNTTFAWVNTPEWDTVQAALRKDKLTINKAAYVAGVSPRVLVSVVIAEQLRFFTSNRESFKKFFEPLKILGSLSQFSLGISGIKPDTAKAIESHLNDPMSPFYVSAPYEHLLDVASDEVRYNRLTDAHDHYYSYLYTAFYLREVEEQWKRAGFNVTNRPEVLATIFNLGFGRSNPNSTPLVSGSQITVGGETYSFGRLSYEFYYSGELADVFGF